MTNNDDNDLWRDCNEEEQECCRLWFEFLKLSDKAKWSEDVARYFDVDYFSDELCSFDEWWPSHKYLFRQLKDIEPIVEIYSVEDYLVGLDDGSFPEMPVVALFVHMWASKDDINTAFKAILEKYHTGKMGRPEFDGNAFGYRFFQRPDIQVLSKALAVYRAHKQKKKPLWEIEEGIRLINREKSDAYKEFKPYENLPPEEVEPDIYDSWRNSQELTVRRYLKCARKILENVVIGKFPVYKL